MMIVFPLLFTLLLVAFGGTEDHNKCERSVWEIFQFLQTESYGRKEFEKDIEMYAIDNNLQRGHKALKEVIEDLGVSIHIKDDMPLQTYLIRYQKHLHDKAEKGFSQMLDDEAIHIDQLIGDLEKELDRKLQKDKMNSISVAKHLSQKISDTEEELMKVIGKLWIMIDSKENKFIEMIDSIETKLIKKIDSVQDSVTNSSNDLFNDLKQAFMNITHTIVLEALQPLRTKNEILDQKITRNQINMTTKTVPYDCSDIRKTGEQKSGVYLIYPQGEAVSVYCDMTTDGGGWTLFLKRHKQPTQENFHRNWTDYRNGFGTPPNEYWLGNDILSVMTNQRDYAMRTDAVGPGTPAKVWGEYSHFQVANETSKYQLSISGRNARDTMDTHYQGFSYNNDQYFSTYERDNDKHSGGHNCAQDWGGGFWHNACSYHFPTRSYEKMQFRYWSKVDKKYRNPTEVEMKIRPRNWRE